MKILKLTLAIVALALLFSQCRYDFIVPEEISDPNDPDAPEVLFSTQIEPIFQSCTACHFTNGRSPDLTAGNSYSSITANYVNIDTPNASSIYTKPNPSASGSHPKYTDGEAALLLTWITQGAKNN